LPLNVLSIGAWTRFLTPGLVASPDLGAAISMSPQPMLYLHVVHAHDTFRIALPVDGAVMSGLSATKGSNDALAISFDLVPAAYGFACWSWGSQGSAFEEYRKGKWKAVGDFTGGAASAGGRCELTGLSEVCACFGHRGHG
jgi:hypothetical protein